MNEEIHFIYDPSEKRREELYKKLDLIFDIDKRARAKFMKNFVIALIEANRK